jgi:CBS domain-containing protein
MHNPVFELLTLTSINASPASIEQHEQLTGQGLEQEVQVKELMSREVVWVNPSCSVWHAAQIMLDLRVSGLPVVDDNGRLIGILTEGDLLRRIELGTVRPDDGGPADATPEERSSSYVKQHSWKVADVMTGNVVVAMEETPVSEAVTMMSRHGIGRLPVLRDGRLAGILSRHDVLRIIASARPSDVASGDANLRLSILARISDNPLLRNARIAVTVSNGLVDLSGTLESDHLRDVVRVLAERLRGVAGVRDHMQTGK